MYIWTLEAIPNKGPLGKPVKSEFFTVLCDDFEKAWQWSKSKVVNAHNYQAISLVRGPKASELDGYPVPDFPYQMPVASNTNWFRKIFRLKD